MILVIAAKTVREILREPPLAAMLVVAPLLFLGVLRLGYGAPRTPTHPVAVFDPDGAAADLLAELEATRHQDGRPVFDLRPVTDPEQAEEQLVDRDVDALLIVSDDSPSFTLRGEASDLHFVAASKLLRRAIHQHADRVAGRPRVTQLRQQALTRAEPDTLFDVHAPGMLVFAILLLIPQTAFYVSREIRRGTLRRLRLTRMRGGHLLAGVTLAQLGIAAIQVPLVFGAALLLGYRAEGSLLLGIGLALTLCLSAVGLGLVVACFADNDGQAVNLGAAVMMIQVIVCGAFFQLPPMTLFELADHPVGAFDLLPATHGMLALQQVLTYGDGPADVAFRTAATLALSLAAFVVGVGLFHRAQMRRG